MKQLNMSTVFTYIEKKTALKTHNCVTCCKAMTSWKCGNDATITIIMCAFSTKFRYNKCTFREV